MSRKDRLKKPLVGTATVVAVTLLLAGGSGASTISGHNKVAHAKTTLTVWSFMPSEYANGVKAYNAVVSAFEAAYPQVKVVLDNIPYNVYFQRVRDATIAHTGPDVITMYGGAQAYSYRAGLEPMQTHMQPSIKANLRFASDNYSKDGNLYILPTGTYGYELVINKNLFRRANINPASGLSSWSNFLSTCRTMYGKGIQPIASGWKDGYLFETIMYMMSSQLMDSTTLHKWVLGQIPVSASLFVTATDDIVAMNKAHCFGNVAASLGRSMYDDSFNQYYAGKTAMLITGDIGTTQTAFKDVPNSTTMRLPQVPGSKYTNIIDSGAETGWGVTKWAKDPKVAYEFVNFLAGPQAQQIIYNDVGVPPNLKNVSEKPNNTAEKDYVALLENPVNHTGFEAFPLTVLAVYERNAALLIGGSMSVATFTSQAQTAFAQSG